MSPKEPRKIVNTDRIDGDHIIVSYSDETTSVYSAGQLGSLTPTQTVNAEQASNDGSPKNADSQPLELEAYLASGTDRL